MTQCPQCKRRLKFEATSCLCGWGTKPVVDNGKPLGVPGAVCAFDGCDLNALVRVRGDGNSWVNLCVDHYPKWHSPERIMNKRTPVDTPATRSVREGMRDRMPQSNALVDSVPEAFEDL